jgi:hypothetical protein
MPVSLRLIFGVGSEVPITMLAGKTAGHEMIFSTGWPWIGSRGLNRPPVRAVVKAGGLRLMQLRFVLPKKPLSSVPGRKLLRLFRQYRFVLAFWMLSNGYLIPGFGKSLGVLSRRYQFKVQT